MRNPAIGDKVKVIDGPEANGDAGIVLAIQPDGLILVELDDGGAIWPVYANEIESVPDSREGVIVR